MTPKSEGAETMMMEIKAPRYELRAGRLYVEGERVPVHRETVVAAFALEGAGGSPKLRTDDPASPISEELGAFILRLEGRRARRELALSLAPLMVA